VDALPSDRILFQRTVVHESGLRLGRIDVIVHREGGERVAVVRRGRLFRRWFRVSLAGARLVDGSVVVGDDPSFPRLKVAPGARAW